MKKTIIICSCIMLVSISGLAAFLLWHNSNSGDEAGAQMMNQSLLDMIGDDTTYEEFSESFQEGLSDEVLAEAENVFTEIKEAKASEDEETLQQLLIQLNSLNLFADEQNGGFGDREGGQDGFNITDMVGDSDQQGGGQQGGGQQGGGPQGGGPGGGS